MITEQMVRIGLRAQNAEEVLREMAGLFVQNGLAKDSFVEAIIEREKIYPTGLPAEAFDVAIPHTISEHVLTPGIAVAVLEHPVAFQQMGSPEITLRPQLIMMLAIKDPKEQLTLLRKLMKLLQNKELLEAVRAAKTPAEIVEFMEPALQ